MVTHTLRAVTTLSLVALMLALTWGNASAQEASTKSDTLESESEKDARLKEMMRQAGIYELEAIQDSPRILPLHTKPLMRFNNPVGGVPDGVVVMWLDGARPAVLAQVFMTSDKIWLHEMQSMAASPLVLRDQENNRIPWRPRKKGLEWHKLDDVDPPAESKVARRIQMRKISESFSASDEFKRNSADKETSQYQLRLMPRPLYRYPDNAQGMIDGAVFAFVHGTDPEVFVALEAAQIDGKRIWRYALAPMTCWAVQVQYKGSEVWNLPERLNKSSAIGDYHVWRYQ